MSAIIKAKEVTTGVGNLRILFEMWEFYSQFVSLGGRVDEQYSIIDVSPNFSTGPPALLDDDYFVLEVILPGPGGNKFQVLFTANDGTSPVFGLFGPGVYAELSPLGGWQGSAGVPGTMFTGFDVTGFALLVIVPFNLNDCWFWSTPTATMAIFDNNQNGSYDYGYYIGYINSSQSSVDDPDPAVLIAGIPGVRAGQWADSGFSFMLGVPPAVTNVKLLDYTGFMTAANQPNKFSGSNFDELEVLVYTDTPSEELIRGKLKHIRATFDIANKDTLAGKTRIVFNDMSLPWDGSTPA